MQTVSDLSLGESAAYLLRAMLRNITVGERLRFRHDSSVSAVPISCRFGIESGRT